VKTYIVYVPKESLIHKLDPLTKLILLLTLTTEAVLSREPVLSGIVIVIAVGLYLAARLPVKILTNFVRYWLFMFVIAFVSYGWSYRNVGSVMWDFGWIRMTDYAVFLSLSIILRLLSILTLGLMFYCSTTQRDVIAGLRKLKVPNAATFVLALSIRTLSILYDDFRRIREAQMARATEFEKGNFLVRLRKMLMLLAPLIVIALARVGTMSSSIEARGFKVKGGKRTAYYCPTMKRLDYVVVLLLAVETAVVLALAFAGFFTIDWFISFLK
jgi:energy-coupling factor transport system permease protein